MEHFTMVKCYRTADSNVVADLEQLRQRQSECVQHKFDL